jgi:two-component system cell cycle response regulator
MNTGKVSHKKNGKTIKVLIAEDNAVSAKILKKKILNWGYEVVLAKNGEEAWLVLKKEEIKLAILDWMMPKFSGVQLCQKIRENDHKEDKQDYTYIILLTAKDDQKDLIEGFSAGADDYITKPFQYLELKARLKTGKRIIDLQKQLQEQAKRDVLTGLCNRKGMYTLLEKEINRSLRDNRPLTILMADIDKFKTINDKYGHHIGDVVLQETAKILKKRVRDYDEVCRYGGDEFLAILPNCNSANAFSIAERLRQTIGSHKITSDGRSLSIAFSLGGVSSENFGKDITAESLIRKADEALLQAKNTGRNRVVINKKME